MMKKVMLLLVPLVILTAGAFVTVAVLRLAPAPAEAAQSARTIRVDVQSIEAREARATVTATGVATAAQEITVSPEITARIVSRHEALIPGGRLEEGEVLARLDARQYRLALRQEQSRVRTAELELEVEEGRGRVAEQEWEILGDGRPQEEAGLALRRPHLNAARSSLDSAQSSVELARLNLARATIRAPFNAVVVEADADPGQLVSPSSRMATLVGSDELWVRVSVPISALPDIAIPGVNGEEGSAARIIHEIDRSDRVVRDGRVLRLESRLDAQTRTAQLLVVVPNPLDEPEGAVPLLPGAFVTVELEGRSTEQVLVIPRAAVHQGDQVWVVTDEERLSRRTFETRWGTEGELFIVSDELQDGDRLVTSPLSLPVEGARVTVASANAANEVNEVDEEEGAAR